MARTRGASGGVIHDDDGELLDREGKPINPVAHHTSAPQAITPEPPPVAEAQATRIVYVLDKTTVRRDCDAWELAQMFDLYLGPWGKLLSDREFENLTPDEQLHGKISARMPEAEFMLLKADVRRHFVRIVELVE